MVGSVKMSTQIRVWFAVIMLSSNYVCSGISQTKFRITTTGLISATSPVRLTATSRIHCAIHSKTNGYSSFMYNISTGMCTLGGSATGHDAVWMSEIEQDCAASVGYSLYEIAGEIYCLKYNRQLLKPIATRNVCVSEGSHIVTIDSRAMLDGLATLLVTLGHGTAPLFVNGHRPSPTGIMYTHDDQPVPFVDWQEGEPGTQEFLVIIHNGSAYYMKDGFGRVAKPFLCQMF